MASPLILLDTSILIDYYRKTNKNNTVWLKLIDQGCLFSVSTVSKYELYAGANSLQRSFWNNIFSTLLVLPFDELCVDTAVEINAQLRRKRKQIELADLFIAATAVANHIPVATLNIRHFNRVDGLKLYAPGGN